MDWRALDAAAAAVREAREAEERAGKPVTPPAKTRNAKGETRNGSAETRNAPGPKLVTDAPKPVTLDPETRNAPRGADPKPVTVGACACGAPLVKPVRGPTPRHCSPACRQRAYRQRSAPEDT